MSSQELVVLTCASGRQCSHVIPLLYGKYKLRLVVNSDKSAARLSKQWPDAEVVQASLDQGEDARRVIKGATAAFHLNPPFHPREAEICYNMVDAAVKETKDGNFKHFVFSSVLDSQLRKLMNHDVKRYAEEYLIEAGADGSLPYTIIQPTHFMDMFPVKMLMESEKPVYPANWNPDVPFSYIALRDLGEAVANILMQREKHYFAQYGVVSTTPVTYTEFAKIASKEIGKEIKIEQLSYEDSVTAFLAKMGLDKDPHPLTRDAAQRMLLWYNHRGLLGSPNVLEHLLGHPTTSIVEWIRLQIEEAKKSS